MGEGQELSSSLVPGIHAHVGIQNDGNFLSLCGLYLVTSMWTCQAHITLLQRDVLVQRDVLTTAARLCPYLDHSYITAATEATQVYHYYGSNCPIWSMTERSKFLFRTSLFSVVGCSLEVLHGAYGLLLPHILQCFIYLC